MGVVWTFLLSSILPLLFLGASYNLDYSRARACCACSRCVRGLFGLFYSHLSFLSSFSAAGAGWLVGCFGCNCPLRQYFSLYRAVSQREGERRERIDESKNVQTTPNRTYCKHNRPLPYCNQNCRTPRHWKFTQHHHTTRSLPQVRDEMLAAGTGKGFVWISSVSFFLTQLKDGSIYTSILFQSDIKP